ncbi:MAG: hypothetical protein AABX70_07885 [Nanoarchaeota archaeon]
MADRTLYETQIGGVTIRAFQGESFPSIVALAPREEILFRYDLSSRLKPHRHDLPFDMYRHDAVYKSVDAAIAACEEDLRAMTLTVPRPEVVPNATRRIDIPMNVPESEIRSLVDSIRDALS